jgi:hypothetical protein
MITVQSQHQANSSRDPILKIPNTKRAGNIMKNRSHYREVTYMWGRVKEGF